MLSSIPIPSTPYREVTSSSHHTSVTKLSHLLPGELGGLQVTFSSGSWLPRAVQESPPHQQWPFRRPFPGPAANQGYCLPGAL